VAWPRFAGAAATGVSRAGAEAHQRALKHVLQVLGEVEGNQVAQVQRLGGGAAASIQIHRLLLLVQIEDLVEVAVREEDAALRKRGT